MSKDKRAGDNPNAALDAASAELRANLTDAEDEAYQAAMNSDSSGKNGNKTVTYHSVTKKTTRVRASLPRFFNPEAVT
jgi:hypothetical protein